MSSANLFREYGESAKVGGRWCCGGTTLLQLASYKKDLVQNPAVPWISVSKQEEWGLLISNTC